MPCWSTASGCPQGHLQASPHHEPRRRPLQAQPVRRAAVPLRAKVSDKQETQQEKASPDEGKQQQQQQAFDLDAVNPWSAGRRTRHALGLETAHWSRPCLLLTPA